MTPELIEILPTPLSLEKYVAFVADPSAGATATFVGTTRDNFDGRRVVKLEYEAYPDMALKLMKVTGALVEGIISAAASWAQEICAETGRRWDVCRVAMGHRVGTVGVQEASVMIAVSSPHRKTALEACAWAIDALKAKVPIWKKEFFEDGSVWKENRESPKPRVSQSEAPEFQSVL